MNFFLLPLIVLAAQHAPQRKVKHDYDLLHPDKQIVLPEELKEISALTDVTQDLLACVQDEKGVIYYFSISQHKVVQQDSILPNGDFEGLTYHDSTFYILRSEGTLFMYNLRNRSIDSIRCNLPAIDNEGLGWNPQKGKLMIASKSSPGKGPVVKDQRDIYLFDPLKKNQQPEKYFSVDLIALRKKAAEKKLHSGKYTKDGRPKEIQFRPSSLAVLPGTDQLFVLSATDPFIAVYHVSGTLLDLYAISPELLSKPEGITFLSDKTMIISSEGKSAKPSLAFYTFRGRK